MSDQPKPNRPLSEISHLFLSSVRDKQTGGAPRPVRKPPQPIAQSQPEPSDDLTPEEYAHVFGESESAAHRPAHAPPVTAIISSHLNGRQFDRIKEYAGHLCAIEGRVGLIELDASEFRVMCFDRGTQQDPETESAVETFDPRQMSAAIEELNFDIDHWLLALPNPRTPEARALLREIEHWVLLSTCDHDGVVSAYRTLKGLAETRRPRLSLGILDARDEVEVGGVFRKLAGVCQQFLGWQLEPEAAVTRGDEVAEHLVMLCRPTRDKAQLAAAPQWQVVSNFVTKLKSDRVAKPIRTAPEISVQADARAATRVADRVSATKPSIESTESFMQTDIAAPLRLANSDRTTSEVFDLPGGDASPTAIIATVLAQPGNELVECPVRAPMCAAARLAVSRERGLVLLAVARQGLDELRAIGLAYRWLLENRTLIGMALPQFAIDAHTLPIVHLLVDQADASAETLQPLLQAGNVTVRTYRTLRWGQKLGLLLEAA